MSYCVEYNPELRKQYPVAIKERKKPPVRLIACILLATVGGFAFLASGLSRYLLPGNPEATSAAFSELIAQVEAGESVKEAFLAFCVEIITSGQ